MGTDVTTLTFDKHINELHNILTNLHDIDDVRTIMRTQAFVDRVPNSMDVILRYLELRNDYRYAYWMATQINGIDAALLQQIVVDKGSVWDVYWFARDVKDTNITTLQQVILERGNGLDAYRFAKDVDGADTGALQQVILERGDGWGAYWFAKDIPGADIPALQKVVFDRGSAGDAYLFARDVIGADLQPIYARLVDLHALGEDDDTNYLAKFVKHKHIQHRLQAQQNKDIPRLR